MQVVSTAGHGGHGKSALVRALTGTEPGEPGAWTELPSGRRVAFVDVPGDERSVPAMLAGAAPAPAVLLAVAADEGWMPQTAEHLEALGALGVRSGVLAVTKADAADPRLALRLVRDKLAGTALRGMEAVPVSTVTGAGIDELTAALDRLAGPGCPSPTRPPRCGCGPTAPSPPGGRPSSPAPSPPGRSPWGTSCSSCPPASASGCGRSAARGSPARRSAASRASC
ncbi:GTP-binding protein [Actinomadura madurae]|uniref:GTP-binding protein n=1 Tax=Actinomadura madurae TaxID=1993 RepID=UPI0020D22838|nr:GTP-binding protein [Actinomadura madurae]MCP9964654.1 GTP-binding protein [Actinomadura madurae]MCQ0013326.1 GTP-binding protein [Actinomadura madurae]